MSKTVIVLGAGATRGWDSREKQANGQRLPALDRDFFDRLQELSDGQADHADLVRRVTADARWVAKGSIYPTLEEMFTFVEASLSLGKVPIDFRINGREPKQVKKDLEDAIALQLGSALCKAEPGEGNDCFYHCKHHLWLAKPTQHGGAGLTQDDTIISFNYDCLMDFALARGSKAWNAKHGYLLDNPNQWEQWTSGMGSDAPAESLKLLKLHGSLNWLDKEDRSTGVTLSVYNYRDVRRPLIIPPEWNKQIDGPPFDRIWMAALEAVRTARTMVFIGYSMPLTDLRAQVMFRAGRQTATEELEKLVVVNPDETAARRIVHVLEDGMRSTPVLRLDRWEDFACKPVQVWRH